MRRSLRGTWLRGSWILLALGLLVGGLGGCGAFQGPEGSVVSPAASAMGADPSPPVLPWPGPAEVQVVDRGGVFGENLSGLHLEVIAPAGAPAESPGYLWAVRNGPSTLFRLVFDLGSWVPDPSDGWGQGRPLRYADGSGDPDAEGVTRVGEGPWAGVYVATERDNDVRGESRNAVLRFEVGDSSEAGVPLLATHVWELNHLLPPTGPNRGIEALTWIPDAFLQERGFVAEGGASGEAEGWVRRPGGMEGGGVFVVGVEETGELHFVALDHSAVSATATGMPTARHLARVDTGLAGVMGLHFDRETGELWAVCDNVCQGRMAVLELGPEGSFEVARFIDPPAGLPDLNNEGFTVAPLSWCRQGRRPTWWADDDETDGLALRQGWLTCL